MTTRDKHATFAELLRSALEAPSTISRAYINPLLALAQCLEGRGARNPIFDHSALRTLKAADRILCVGRTAAEVLA